MCLFPSCCYVVISTEIWQFDKKGREVNGPRCDSQPFHIHTQYSEKRTWHSIMAPFMPYTHLPHFQTWGGNRLSGGKTLWVTPCKACNGKILPPRLLLMWWALLLGSGEGLASTQSESVCQKKECVCVCVVVWVFSRIFLTQTLDLTLSLSILGLLRVTKVTHLLCLGDFTVHLRLSSKDTHSSDANTNTLLCTPTHRIYWTNPLKWPVVI